MFIPTLSTYNESVLHLLPSYISYMFVVHYKTINTILLSKEGSRPASLTSSHHTVNKQLIGPILMDCYLHTSQWPISYTHPLYARPARTNK